jgi:AcrR family transcriptional regulator
VPDDRSERVLDAAAELLVRWGYQRVTIDDVARHAGIGKGTVYLHFRTKESLFLTVLLRAHHGVLSGMADRVARDPAQAMPSEMLRSVYLELAADAVMRPLYLGDGEILGRLAHEASATLGELATARDKVVRAQFGLLREAGCVRTDLDVDAQLHVMGAVGVGFFFTDNPPVVPDAQVRADLLAYTIAAAIEVPDRPPAAAASVAPAIAELLRSLITHVDDELRRRVR